MIAAEQDIFGPNIFQFKSSFERRRSWASKRKKSYLPSANLEWDSIQILLLVDSFLGSVRWCSLFKATPLFLGSPYLNLWLKICHYLYPEMLCDQQLWYICAMPPPKCLHACVCMLVTCGQIIWPTGLNFGTFPLADCTAKLCTSTPGVRGP